jgi:hypothetical protein
VGASYPQGAVRDRAVADDLSRALRHSDEGMAMVDAGRPAGVRTLAPGGMPLLVADLPDTPEGVAVRDALRSAGLRPLEGLIGIDFPRGAAVGVLLEGEEVRLVDNRETTLLRLDRRGLAAEWLDAAVRLKGTMLAVATAIDVATLEDPSSLGARLETEARDGRLDGAIVGVADRRPRLPLVF